MKERKKKVEISNCNKCGKLIEGNPPFAIIRHPMPVFCTKECIDSFTQVEKEKRDARHT